MPRAKKLSQPVPAPAPAALPAVQPLMPQAVPAMPQPIAVAENSATVVINKADYNQVRDSVLSRISTLQTFLSQLAQDYLRQSNLLSGEPTTLDSIPPLAPVGNFDHAALSFAPPVGEAVVPAEEKKERKKRQHDPNAPKRPLTPYFLYMQTARPIIANDLGSDAPKGAVQVEGQRRWGAMSDAEKMAWDNAYKFNLRLYNARVHSYKAGNLQARDMSDQDALAYADANNIPQPPLGSADEAAPHNEQDAITEQLQASVPAPAAASPEEVKTPKPKATRKRKSTAAVEAEDAEASAAKPATPAASPDKKRKRQSKAAAETPSEEPKKSGRKKKSTA